MKSVFIFCLGLVFSVGVYAGGATNTAKIESVEVHGGYSLYHFSNTSNYDGCSNIQKLALNHEHLSAKQIHSIISLAFASGLNVSFNVDGCFGDEGAETYPLIGSVKVEAR